MAQNSLKFPKSLSNTQNILIIIYYTNIKIQKILTDFNEQRKQNKTTTTE